jgi:hypothetical protein
MHMNGLHRVSAAAIAIAAILAIQPQFAHASAKGAEQVPAFPIDYKGISLPVPKGFLFHSIDGKHRTVKKETATYSAAISAVGLAAGRACNWRIDFQYKDLNGKVYRTDKGPTNVSCNFKAGRTVRPGTLPHYGKACAKLYVNGKHRATQCHSITKPWKLF